MIFEKIGAAELDKDLRCLKIQIDVKIYLIGLQDLEHAKDNRIIPVFQIKETPVQQETSMIEKSVEQTDQEQKIT